ncbi:hypothetical protein GpartN1_g7214.t1 [Galdieria partita]|uniref:Glutamate N-acetyltransferase n=1 Tax=Galdieria partita TaxID=83374 RepID=A0A9C7Q2T3_9RHOD|nr:hypothetical protein GpartN1_g7214.t1 [Galdieria partita]
MSKSCKTRTTVFVFPCLEIVYSSRTLCCLNTLKELCAEEQRDGKCSTLGRFEKSHIRPTEKERGNIDSRCPFTTGNDNGNGKVPKKRWFDQSYPDGDSRFDGSLFLVTPLMVQYKGSYGEEFSIVYSSDLSKLPRGYECIPDVGRQQYLCHRSLESHNLWEQISSSLLTFFLPEGFPESVGDSYLQYSIWRGIQNIISNISQVLSTQALLLAAGVGRTHSETLAAATAWAWKDGVGQVGRLFTAVLGNQYDADPKRWRLVSDLLYDIGLSLEILSPAFSKYFLLLAALGNISKSIAFAIGISCRYSVLKTFVRRENLGEISAKNDAQNVVTGMLGTFLGVWMSKSLPAAPKVRLGIFLFFTAIYSFFNYKSMQVAELTTINRQRGNILAHSYLMYQNVPNVSISNSYERFVPLFPTVFQYPNVKLGVGLRELSNNIGKVASYTLQFSKEKYILSLNNGEIRVALHRNHQSVDLLQLLLHIAFIRDQIQRHLGPQCTIRDVHSISKGECKATRRRLLQSLDVTFCERIVTQGLKYAKLHVDSFHSLLKENGFSTTTILLAPQKCFLVW